MESRSAALARDIEPRPPVRWSTYWMISSGTAVALTALGVGRNYLLLTLRHATDQVSVWRLVRLESPAWIVWTLLLPALVVLCARRPIRSRRDVGRIAWHLFMLPLFHVALTVGTRLVNLALSPAPRPPFELTRALFWIDPTFTVVLYTSVTAILHLVRYAREQAFLREQLALVRVESLQRQLQPHFLFNTLNTISSLISREPLLARQLLTRLGALLRRALADNPHALVPLAEELDFLRDYLALQEARFRHALRASIDVAPDAGTVPVPWMLLQPLVENAITHGASADGVCRVTVRGHVDGGQLVLIVEDEGPGFSARSTPRSGVGLRNTRERLATLVGDAATLRLETAGTGGARVTLSMPAGGAGGQDMAAEPAALGAFGGTREGDVARR